MRNKNNLKPAWEKGQSGNPNGYPKGKKNRSTIVKKWLEVQSKELNEITGEIEQLSQEDLITLALLKKARNGDVNAYKQLMGSAYGLPQQHLDINSERGIFKMLDLEVIS